MGVVIAGGSIASNVTLPHVFQSNTPARASEVNANFSAVKTAVDDNFARITGIEMQVGADGGTGLSQAVMNLEMAVAALTARVTALEATKPVTAIQTNDLLVSTVGTWTDIPGATVNLLTTKPSTDLIMTAHGTISRYGGLAPWVRCGLRIVVDGSPLNSDGTLGHQAVSPNGPNNAAEYIPFALAERTTVGAGPHTIKVQMARAAVAGMTEVGECAIYRWTFSRTKLTVQAY